MSLRMLRASCLLAVLAGWPLAAAEKPAFTILFTAEVHGALLPCDCPLEPLGGLARRATLVKRYRERGPVLLVDVGGWAPGGMYDEYSDGDPERDKLRTKLMAQAMLAMKYDGALCDEHDTAMLEGWTGADESLKKEMQRLQLNDPKALEQELMMRAPRPLVKRLHAGAVGVQVLPYASQRWSLRLPDAPFKLWLNPGGEASIEALEAEYLSLFDLIIFAGRKTSQRVAWTAGNAVLANFDYQAQRLGVAEVFPRKGRKDGDAGVRWELRVRHEPLTPEIPDDPEIAALLQPHLETLRKKGKKIVEIEFWTLPQCPYCVKLESELKRLAADVGERAVIVPRFLVNKKVDGSFTAMHGPKELEEAGIQALVARYYPERFWDWLQWRHQHPEAGWEAGAKALGLLQARIRGALEAREHLEIFERDAQLALRRRIQGTPTLVLANRIYDGEYERLKILRALCGMLDEPRPEVCKQVPACFLDSECRKRGFIGKCVDAGTPAACCDFSQAAVKVPVTVLCEPDALYSNHERILEVLLGRLPGLEWRLVDPASDEGKGLVERYKPERFPAYLLDVVARTEQGFAENLADAVEARADALALKQDVNGAHRLVSRPRQPGRADLFVARFSQSGSQAVEVGLESLTWLDAPELVFHDALFWNERRQPDGKAIKELAARGGIAEIEDAAIAEAVRQLFPQRLHDYLKERAARRGSQFGWDRALALAGIDVARIRGLAEGPDLKGPAPPILKALHAAADLLQALGAGGDVVLLGENCEVIPVRSRDELRYYLELIGKRKPKAGDQK